MSKTNFGSRYTDEAVLKEVLISCDNCDLSGDWAYQSERRGLVAAIRELKVAIRAIASCLASPNE